MLTVLFWLFIAFALLWLGAGLAVKSVTTISHGLKMSSFFVSFFVLGVFTSITEILVGINALIENRPEIYVGNLIGSTVVVYLLVIPLVAVAGNGIKLSHSLHIKDIINTCIVAALPALLTLDNNFNLADALISIAFYVYTLHTINRKSSLLERVLHNRLSYKTLWLNIAKTALAVALVFVGSRILVTQIPTLGNLLHISPFIISLFLVSVGTNIPELSIAIRAIVHKHKEVALGNYLGSAALNTFEIGVLTLLGRDTVRAEGSNYSVLAYVVGLLLFIIFMKSKNDISRKEGRMLFLCYAVFAFFEFFTGPGWNF